MGRRRLLVVTAVAATLVAAVGVAHAQRYFREGSYATRLAPPQMPDASFVVCRLAYRSVRAEPSGIGWQTDYPYAEINLMTRLSELTKTRVSRDESQQPELLRRPAARSDALFNCPFLVASDAGTVGFRDDEAEHLRGLFAEGRVLLGGRLLGHRRRGATGPRRSPRCCRPTNTRSKMSR